MRFVKDASVFNEWQADTPKVLASSFNHDIANWKIDKITKDLGQQSDVKNVIHKYYEQLKNIFMQSAVDSNTPPDISKRQFY